ncbi:MAG: glycosyltransferase family 2 protein [Dehalococcoidia bacterium]|nr:glycosyltransferase family 2 protein [Dehalococcoidia bacterium]
MNRVPPDEPFLSVVIPAYNEERRILFTLRQVTSYLSAQAYTWSVLVADDGSTDGTAALVTEFAREQPQVLLLPLPHRGKGGAVRSGILSATAQYRFLCDADLSMPIEQLERFLPPQLAGCDVAIGSREAKGARRIGEPWRRHLQGRLFNAMTAALAVPGIRDTQCGFKCFSSRAAEALFPLQRIPGFGFDVEVLFMARRKGLRLAEVPIDWHYRTESKVRPLRDGLAMSRDLLRVRWNAWRGKYGRRGPAYATGQQQEKE